MALGLRPGWRTVSGGHAPGLRWWQRSREAYTWYPDGILGPLTMAKLKAVPSRGAFWPSYGGGSGRHPVVQWFMLERTRIVALRGCPGMPAAATQIVIRADLSPERQRETVVHEIAHAAFEESACAGR